MKLLVVTPYFYPKIGGLEKYAYNFCIGLKKKYKWDIVVVTSNHIEKKDQVEKVKGLKIYRLASLMKFSNTPVNPFWFWKIKKIIQDEKPDAINAHTPVPFIADIAALTAGNIPFFLTYHAFSLYKYNSILFNLFIKFYKIFEYALFKKATKIVLASYVIKDTIPDKFKAKIVVLNNSISLENIPTLKSIKSGKKEKIVFIGSLDKSHDWKGLDELLLSIKLYRDKTKKDIALSVIGDGNNKDHYRQLAKDYGITKNIKFWGKREGRKKDKILKNATMGIIYPKSSNDAFPTVLLEYWSYSLPVIASNITPINKIIKDKKTAYLTDSNDPNALFNAIKTITDDKVLSKNISKGGHNELLKRFILEKEVKKFYYMTKGYTI